MSEHRDSEPRVDRTAFSVFSSFEEADAADDAYWRSRTPDERLAHLELPTGDIDVWIRLDSDNARRVADAVREFGFDTPDVTPEVFMQEGRIIRMGNAPVRIEILNLLSGVSSDESYPHRVETTIDGVDVTVIGLADLKTNNSAQALAIIPDPEKQCHSEAEGGAATDHANSTAARAPTEESGGWAHRPVGHHLLREKPARQAAPLPDQILRSALLLPRQ